MDFDFDLYNTGNNTLEPKSGALLISQPLLKIPYFYQSVIFILERDRNMGHIGLVLNKETKLTFSDLLKGWRDGDRIPVYSGGPVDEERLFMLHTLGDILGPSTEIVPGLFIGGDLDKLATYITHGGELEGKIRFFLGYSGWTKGQLEDEIAQGSWAVSYDVDSSDILCGQGKEYWRREVERLGDEFSRWLHVPENPRDN